MKLLLSSAALPGASLAELTAACQRRALAGLELTLLRGHRHGVGERVDSSSPGISRDPDTPVEWLLLPEVCSAEELAPWAEIARDMRAGLLLREWPDAVPSGCRIALVHGSDPEDAQEAVAWAVETGVGTSWHIGDEGRDRDLLESILAITRRRLVHVRLTGAGPEAGNEPGSTGTGLLMAKLALSGYTGSIALVPSASKRLPEWEEWLLLGRGWGCGTAAEKKDRKNGTRVTITL
ncbi:MAG TPA: hypothetical protein VF190_03115 [Rhodothermales bacterium]